MVASFLGQTANKTRIQLYSSLEGVLFIDEAYQVGGCPNEDAYGMESLTELVAFLEKYIGISIVIVAGYEKEMEMCFFDRNEGLRRRFPIKYQLSPYNSAVLFKILLVTIFRNYPQDLFVGKLNELQYLYRGMVIMNDNNLFPNMGGSVQILAGKILRFYLGLNDLHVAIVSSLYEYIVENSSKEMANTIFEQLNGK